MFIDILQHKAEEDTHGYGCEGEEGQGGEAGLGNYRTKTSPLFVHLQDYLISLFVSGS